ncbi:MAG: phenylalanine--tRNA ligase subunit beta [Eubacteriales bacterium]|jgi:phenylalanyl-tRNA synthetase beta chain
MKAPLKWIKQYVEFDGTPKEFEAGMTMSGSKVETVDFQGAEIEKVVVGRIEKIEKHPDADKLVVCQLNVGGEELLQIVTGAKNVSEGDIVPVALDGSTLPGGVKIKKGKLRGVVSNGMLCSFHELGLTQNDVPYGDDNGILLLPADREYILGEDIRTVLGLDDYVVDFEITSNRPDCLSVTGLAREAGVTFGKAFHFPEIQIQKEDASDDVRNYLDVEVVDGERCPRYMARAVKNIRIEPSPDWMREALRGAGVRPINNIVDITNYVMLELGQPMHAFDYKDIRGGKIVVRRAKNGETLTTLDEVERKLDDSMLVIADTEGPVAVAGVMGGEQSGIHEDTHTIVFESANFFGPGVRLTAKKLGMRTEASGRYEKGLDPNIAPLAVNRACQLCELLGCGTVVGGVIDVDNSVDQRVKIPLRVDYINRFLGTDISREEMVRILTQLEFTIDSEDNVLAPTFRTDIESIADVAEEIVRMYGYNNIPTTLFRDSCQGRLSPVQQARKVLHTTMLAQGLSEIATYTFISPKYYDKIALPSDSPLRKCVVITNPLGEDTSVMRTTTLPSMMEILALNHSHRNARAALYELGTIYLPGATVDELPEEKQVLTIGFYNNGDYYHLKGIVERALEAMGIEEYDVVAQKENPSYHPGRCADILVNGEKLGTMGQIHPLVARNYGISQECYVAEIDFNTLYANRGAEKGYTPLPKFPAVTRDLALVCDDSLPVASIQKVIRANGGRLLEQVELFDVYKGKQIEEGKKSVAYALTLRDREKTLTDEEIDTVMKKIMRGLEKELGVVLRG